MYWYKASLKQSSVVLPHRMVTNQELVDGFWLARTSKDSALPSHSVQKLFRQTGIKTRRYAQAFEATSDLAARALAPLLSAQKASSLNCLIVSTTSPDHPSPATAHVVHKICALPNTVHCFDVASSCSSFLSALRAGLGLLQGTQPGGAVCVVASEVKHKGLAKDDLRTRALFGDGACGVWLENKPSSHESFCFAYSHTDSELVDKIKTHIGGSREPVTALNVEKKCLEISDPKSVYIHTVKAFVAAIEDCWTKRSEALSHKGLNPNDVGGMIYLHQANANILKDVKARLAPDIAARIPILMSDIGNMVCASLPVLRARSRFLEGLLNCHLQNDDTDLPTLSQLAGRLESLKNQSNSEPVVKTAHGLRFEQTVDGEDVSVLDEGCGQSAYSWLYALDEDEFATVRDAVLIGRPEASTSSVDVWIAAGGGFQTLGLLHARGIEM